MMRRGGTIFSIFEAKDDADARRPRRGEGETKEKTPGATGGAHDARSRAAVQEWNAHEAGKVEPTNDHCNSERQLSCGEKPCECAASVCGAEAEKCEE